jgi:Fur family peroxide stress response transcriptional regulator
MAMDPQARLGELVDKLREMDCRITPQRMAVLRILAASEEHLTAEQVYEQVSAELPMTSLATVYKTLSLLEELGEVMGLALGNGVKHYDGARPYPHPHLVCTNCGTIVDLPPEALQEITQRAEGETGYEITSHRLTFCGVCPRCQVADRSNS